MGQINSGTFSGKGKLIPLQGENRKFVNLLQEQHEASFKGMTPFKTFELSPEEKGRKPNLKKQKLTPVRFKGEKRGGKK